MPWAFSIVVMRFFRYSGSMDNQLFQSWRRYVPNLSEVLKKMQEKTIIAVGVAPYPRIMPSLFLDRYAIYCVKDAVDIDLLRNYTQIFCLEEKHPKVAAKVHATGYLLRNWAFQAFLRSRRYPYRLMFYQTTPKIVETLEEEGIEWIGNSPESFKGVMLKGDFRDLVKKRELPSIPDWRLSREDFLKKSFADAWAHWDRPFVVQRADFDVAGELGTFFIRNKTDWQKTQEILSKDDRYHFVTISPFIEGHSVSMLGCITPQGVLTSTLQLQLIDVPESLHGQLPTGVFLGHDWTFHPWTEKTERTAQNVVESIGGYLAEHGFKGIFGIDFVYDAATHDIFPIECNPRFTGALPVYSLMVAHAGVPTIEFFHIAAHLEIDVRFDFMAVNDAFKHRYPLAHISLTPKGIAEMKIPLAAGVYSYNKNVRMLRYERPGAFYRDFKNPEEFMIIDSLPRLGGRVIQNVPRLCKLIFPRQIARSSFAVEPEIGELITSFSEALRKDQVVESPAGAESYQEF